MDIEEGSDDEMVDVASSEDEKEVVKVKAKAVVKVSRRKSDANKITKKRISK